MRFGYGCYFIAVVGYFVCWFDYLCLVGFGLFVIKYGLVFVMLV